MTRIIVGSRDVLSQWNKNLDNPKAAPAAHETHAWKPSLLPNQLMGHKTALANSASFPSWVIDKYPNASTSPGTASGSIAIASSTPRPGSVVRTTTYAMATPRMRSNRVERLAYFR